MSKKLTVLAVIAIIILAACLRLWGSRWGLPDSMHYYSYHPDENMVLGAARAVNLFDGQFDPGFYNYGSLYIYMVSFGIVLSAMFGIINLDATITAAVVRELSGMYLAGRMIALFLGLSTVYLVYLIGKRAYGNKIGLLAALMMAIAPIHVMHSKFIAVDVPATFFIALTLVFAFRIPQENHRLRDYALAGLFSGLAAATKYNACLIMLTPIVAHLATSRSKVVSRILNPRLFTIPVCAVVGFLLGTPGVMINYPKFTHDFMYEVQHVRTGHGLVFVNTGSGWVYHIVHSLLPGLGLPLLLLVACGVLYALKKRTVGDLVLLSFLVIYYLMIGAAQVRFARYIIPMLPILMVLGARGVIEFISYLRSGSRLVGSARFVVVGLLVLICTYSLGVSVALDKLYAREDTRNRAVAWMRGNIPQGESIGFATIPWFYTPPFEPTIGALAVASERLDRAASVTDYTLVVSPDKEWDRDELVKELPDHLILSQFEYEDLQRLKDPNAAKYFETLDRYYGSPRRFEDGPRLFGRSIPLLGKLPHDMSYASPTILIYTRKAG